MSLPFIYNCHIHTFTAEHIPDNFLPFGLVKAMRHAWLRGPILWLFGRIVPLSNKEVIARTGRFLARGAFESQAKVFEYIQKQYPEETRFIVLPMDMEFMGAGKPAVLFEGQIKELTELRDELNKHKKTRGQLIPFCAVDPRRPNVVEEFSHWVRDFKVRGVKIYPNLGYRPDNPVLKQIYRICAKEGLPVLAHCSAGGVRASGLSVADAARFAHPANYQGLLKEFPGVNFCLGHFGGSEEWEKQLTGEWPRTGPHATWLTVITEMMRSGKYPNLYADISYTIFTEMPSYRPFNYFDFLKILLTDQNIRGHVLFGTDYYMVEREKVSEKEVSIALRAHLGDEHYFQIAYYNPTRYLGEKPADKGNGRAGRKSSLKKPKRK